MARKKLMIHHCMFCRCRPAHSLDSSRMSLCRANLCRSENSHHSLQDHTHSLPDNDQRITLLWGKWYDSFCKLNISKFSFIEQIQVIHQKTSNLEDKFWKCRPTCVHKAHSTKAPRVEGNFISRWNGCECHRKTEERATLCTWQTYCTQIPDGKSMW